jgi:hypothetical protein
VLLEKPFFFLILHSTFETFALELGNTAQTANIDHRLLIYILRALHPYSADSEPAAKQRPDFS